MKSQKVDKFKAIKEKIKPKVKEEEYKPGMENELDFLRKQYLRLKEQQERFYNTSFFKKRILTIVVLLIGLIVASYFAPTNQNAVLNEFSYLVMILFILIIAFVDQMILGLYLYRRQKAKKKVIE